MQGRRNIDALAIACAAQADPPGRRRVFRRFERQAAGDLNPEPEQCSGSIPLSVADFERMLKESQQEE